MAAAAVVLTTLACVVGQHDFLVLVADVVLRPADVALILWSVGVVGSVLLIGATALPRRRSTSVLPVVVIGVPLAVVLLTTGVWCLGALASTRGRDALSVDAFTVVPPTGSDGCALVVHERGIIRISSGVVYAVGTAGVARRVGAWSADEIQLPVRDGAYSLSWDGRIGYLRLLAERFISPTDFTFECES